MFNLSEGIGVAMRIKVGPDLPSIPRSVLEGKMMLQNLPSIVVGHALGPIEGEVILDMCCAPGGNMSHVAFIMRNKGLIVACDKSRKKIIEMRELFDKMGATCIVPLALDSTNNVICDDSQWKRVNDVRRPKAHEVATRTCKAVFSLFLVLAVFENRIHHRCYQRPPRIRWTDCSTSKDFIRNHLTGSY